MKGIGDVIYNLLTNDTDVFDIIGNKVFPYLAHENISVPYVVYEHVSSDPNDTKDGPSCLDVKDYNIEMYAKDLSELYALSNAIRLKLDRYSGVTETISIDSVRWIDENSGYSDVDRIFLRIQTYSIREKRN